MVSFQCEGCGDVQTKKKLDSHWNQCHAPFTCIDCMTTFHGSDYRSHTSCMTEDQKYQGALYREKPSKANKRKSVSILEPSDQNTLVPVKPYVEDVVEVHVPPEVPTPPPAVPSKSADSVFDYMVDDGPQGTPKIAFTEKKEDVLDEQGEMSMKRGAPSVFSRPSSRSDYRNEEERDVTADYEGNGFSYGTGPVNPRPLDMNGSSLSLDFMTPAAKVTKTKLDKAERPAMLSHSRTNSGSEKKRKRGQADEATVADTPMGGALDTVRQSIVDTPAVVHTGLTGGLSRMVTSDQDYPFRRSPSSSPDPQRGTRSGRSGKRDDPISPLKRTRRTKDDGLGISIKTRAGKVLSMVGGALTPTAAEGALVKTRRRASSSDQSRTKEGEKRERKKHKVTRHNGTSSANVRYERSSRRHASEEPSEPRGKLKAIEYHKPEDYSNSDSEDGKRRGGDSQMVVFGEDEKMKARCESFLAYVTKGPHSTHGYSVNKALKRWHRDRDVHRTISKQDEEKELWRGLRLKKNDRGEIVVFF